MISGNYAGMIGTGYAGILTAAGAAAGGGGGTPVDFFRLTFENGSNGNADATDESGNNRTVNWYNGAVVSNASPFEGSLHMGAIDDGGIYCDADGGFGTDDFTVEFYARSNLFDFIADQPIFALTEGSGSDLVLRLDQTPDQLRLESPAFTNAQGTTGLSTTVWYHIAIVRNGTSLKVYLDGNEEISITLSGSESFGGAGSSLFWGILDSATGGSNAQYWRGSMFDMIRVRKGEAIYTANFTRPTSF